MKSIKSLFGKCKSMMFAFFALFAGLMQAGAMQLAVNSGTLKFVNPFDEYDQLLKAGEGRNFESFEQSFENFAGRLSSQDLNKLSMALKRMGATYDFENFNELDAENLVQNFRRIPAQFQPKIAQAVKGMGINMLGNPNAGSFTAQFDLTITRHQQSQTRALPYDLPIHIFNPLNYNNGFAGFINGLLPAGVTCTVSIVNNSVVFSFTNGVDTDTVTIAGVTNFYSTMLAGLMNAEFKVDKLRLSSTIANYAAWFRQSLATGRRTLFGKMSDTDAIPFTAMKSPIQNDPTILDLNITLHFQNDKGLTYTVPQVFDEAMTVSVFVKDFIVK